MGERKDLSEFDKGQIVMARRPDQTISKTAALVGCSRSAVVSIYQKIQGRNIGEPKKNFACGVGMEMIAVKFIAYYSVLGFQKCQK
ncbi:hypothetical protein QTP86_025402 [Hemibagrus guttatus]|nr:hypothetical protein QTP86_025402 [Hemibagrus guttatus]